MTDPTVVVLAKAPRPGECKTALEPLLGPDGCALLQATLIERAAAWATEVGDAHLAFTPPDAQAEIAPLANGATLFPQSEGTLGDRMAAAARTALGDRTGPILVAGVDTPSLRPAHAAAALDDLDDGIDVTVGPSPDGGYYLIGLRELNDTVFALPPELWGSADVLTRTLQVAHEAGLSLGMLRPERALIDENDARALLADPLTPPDVLAALRPARP